MDKGKEADKVMELEAFLKELKSYKRLLDAEKQLSENQKRYKESLRGKLVRQSGALKGQIIELTGHQYLEGPLTRRFDIWTAAFNTIATSNGRTALAFCIDAVNEAIGKLEVEIKRGIRDKQGTLIKKLSTIPTEPPKAFIAHEGETQALNKLKAFLDALGVTYLIAEIEPSNGRLVEGQVDWSQGQADFVIILATKGKIVDKTTGKPQMGTNVADELGRARQAFKNRIILLLETSLEAHTNIGGIVRARFMPQRMDEAFTKIVKELRNWNLIRTVRVEKE